MIKYNEVYNSLENSSVLEETFAEIEAKLTQQTDFKIDYKQMLPLLRFNRKTFQIVKTKFDSRTSKEKETWGQ